MTITASGPSPSSASASSTAVAESASPESARASSTFGVITVARGSTRSISAAFAAGSSRVAPLEAIITGSTTTGASPTSSRPSSTASIVRSSASIPTLTASTPMSETTARTWATIISGSTAATISTPSVFWAVSAVIAVVPWTPQRANAFRSAWIPAPPPESDPAIARQVRTDAWLTHPGYSGSRSPVRLQPPSGSAAT